MDARQLDRLSRTLAESRGRRSLIAAITGLAMGAAKTPIADAATGTCTRWVIAAGSSPFDKFQHVDDDFLVEVRPKGGGGWSEVFFDNSGGANGVDGRHLDPIEFRANTGDKLRITVFNRQAGGCEFDEVWLYCKGSRRGTRIMRAYQCSNSEGDRLEEFITFEYRIRA